MSDADDEIEFHLDMLTRDLVAGGMNAEDARREALRRFGDVGTVKGEMAAIRQPRTITALMLLALALAGSMHRLLWYLPAYSWLHSHHPYYVAESIKNLCEVSVCCLVLLLTGQRHLRRALGINRRWSNALLFAAVSAWPMFLGFAMVRTSHVRDWIAVAYLAFLSPFAEELVLRGFAFRTLRRIGWPLWPSALLIALVSGLTHIEKGQTRSEILGLFALLAVGGCTFSWMIERWDSLWFPFALHAAMNFSWELFNVSRTAIGGWYAFTLQNAAVILAILITLRFTRSKPIGQNGLGDGRRIRHVTRPEKGGALPMSLAQLRGRSFN